MLRDAPLTLQRLSHGMHSHGHMRCARVVTHLIGFLFSAVLPPEPLLSSSLRMHHHALGVVIHPCVTIGERVQIQHHVLLGTDVSLDSGLSMTIGDDVSVGAHAILLGSISIGARARIGAGAVVTKDVPSGATVVGNPARVIREDSGPTLVP